MLLQLLFLVAVWGGVYVLREQALAISAVYKKAEEKRALDGEWQLTRVSEVTLKLSGKHFWFSRDGKVFFDGEYDKSEDELSFSLLSGTGYAGYWSVRFNHTAEELVIRDDKSGEVYNFVRITLVKMLGSEAGNRAFAEEKVLRFRRVGG